MTPLTDKEILDVALQHCEFTCEGTYHLRKFQGWAILNVVRECIELQRLVDAAMTEPDRGASARETGCS